MTEYDELNILFDRYDFLTNERESVFAAMLHKSRRIEAPNEREAISVRFGQLAESERKRTAR